MNVVSLSNPGPGKYKQVDDLNKQGLYKLSNHKNVKSYSLYHSHRSLNPIVQYDTNKDSSIRPLVDNP